MSRVSRRALSALIIVMLAAIAAAVILAPRRDAKPFLVPSAAQARQAEARFADALLGQGEAVPSGLERRPVSGREEFVLRESEGDCRGRGIYRLRGGPARPLALVAPHGTADRHTGEIVRLLFEEGPVAAAAWNSAPRRASETCPGGGDPARVATHHLTAFSLAFARVRPEGRIVQIHGFAPARRQEASARRAAIIVSDGTREPAPALLALADCLSIGLAPERVLVFPLETSELGATTNRQGRALRASGFGGFAHLELSFSLRERLLTDGELRRRFSACLMEGLA